MRFLLGLVLVALAVAAAWLGGEMLVAHRAARLIADDPRLAAAQVTPLRRLDRIGIRTTDLRVATPGGEAQLPSVEAWAAPSSPNSFNLSLPSDMTLPIAGVPRPVHATDAGASLRVSPANRMAVGRAALSSGAISIASQPLLDRLSVAAELTNMGAGAPRQARAAYDISIAIEGAQPAGLADVIGTGVPAQALAEAGPVGVQGRARLYLDRGLPLRQGGEAPTVAGIASDGIDLTLNDKAATLRGWVQPGAENRAEGAILIDTADARGFLDMAAAAGIIPRGAVLLASGALAAAAGSTGALPAGVPDFPPPPDGQLRLTIIMQDGRMSLGPVPLGAAPILSRGALR